MLDNLKLQYYFIIHLLFLISLYSLFYLLGLTTIIPSYTNLIQWDAGWYKSIVETGYVFQENIQSNTGFFPFFPFLWRLLGGNNIGIVIFNVLIFYIGVFIVSLSLPKINKITVLLSLSFPSLIFMYVPYSEALFFLTASLYLYGNYTSNYYTKGLAIILASLARPTIFFFLPAVIFSEFLGSNNLSKKIKTIVSYSMLVFIGTYLSFYIIGKSSGNIFAYPDSQINNWDHSFSIPKLPLTTWRGYRILWLDFFGLWIVISSLIGAIIYFFKWVKNKMTITFDKNVLLSLSYLSMVLIYVLFFHPKEISTELTSILSLNRYVFCSPFVFYLMYYFYNNNKGNITKVLVIALAFSLLLIGVPFEKIEGLTYIKTLIYCLGLLLFITIQVSPKYYKSNALNLGVYIMNTTLQVYLFQSFIKGNWIG